MASADSNPQKVEVEQVVYKRPRLDIPEEKGETVATNYNDSLTSFGSFKITRILTENPENKKIVVEATVQHSDKTNKALLLLEKAAFARTDLDQILSNGCTLKKEFVNDVYGNFLCFPPAEANAVKVNLIHPATEKHIEKYLPKQYYLVDETPELHETVVKPHIEERNFNLQWVSNILEHRKEKERIVYEDPDPELGFILLPDFKWDGQTVANLYLIAIVHKKGLASLRTLDQESLPMLRNILKQGSKAIEDKYGLAASQQRIYIHYQPSYFHLHIHFTNVNFSAPGSGAERSHLLQTVINNIELLPDYYRRATLPFTVSSEDPLLEQLKSKGFTLVPGSLLSASFNENSLCFRVAVAPPSDHGSHSTQVLNATNVCFPSSTFRPEKRKLIPGKPYKLQCSNCKTLLADSVTFKETFVFPFDDWNEIGNYDFFCHAHNHTGPVGPKHFKMDLTGYCMIGSAFTQFHPLPEGQVDTECGKVLCLSCRKELGSVEKKVWRIWDHALHWLSSSETDIYRTPLDCMLTFFYDVLQRELSVVRTVLRFTAGDRVLTLNVLERNCSVLEGSSEQICINLQHHVYTNVLFRVNSSSDCSTDVNVQVFQHLNKF
nr:EOG090X06NK [Triops cancriformis]